MNLAKAALVAASLAFSVQGAAWACGVCIEDKMAATYDHAVVERALAQRRIVLFCEIKGPVQPARLRAAAARVRGIDARSVRTALEPAALSFAVDPTVQSPRAAVAQLQRALGPETTVTLLRTLPAAE